jgi:hypothetical protein
VGHRADARGDGGGIGGQQRPIAGRHHQPGDILMVQAGGTLSSA